MMTLKFSRNAKVTRVLTGRRPARLAGTDDFQRNSLSALNIGLCTIARLANCCHGVARVYDIDNKCNNFRNTKPKSMRYF